MCCGVLPTLVFHLWQQLAAVVVAVVAVVLHVVRVKTHSYAAPAASATLPPSPFSLSLLPPLPFSPLYQLL